MNAKTATAFDRHSPEWLMEQRAQIKRNRRRERLGKTVLRIALLPAAAAGWLYWFASVGFKAGQRAARGHAYRFVTGFACGSYGKDTEVL
jgi:hypothetical protein